jgi:hypothetical protein
VLATRELAADAHAARRRALGRRSTDPRHRTQTGSIRIARMRDRDVVVAHVPGSRWKRL